MNFVNKHLCVFDKYEDWVYYSNFFIRPNVSYLLDKIVVVYWLNIESIWGLTIGGYWYGGCFKLNNNPTIQGVPSVPDGERLLNLKEFCYGLSHITEIAKFNVDNVTSISKAFYGMSSLNKIFINNNIKFNNVLDASYAFSHCTSLKDMELELPICTDFQDIFNSCSSLELCNLICDNGSNFAWAFANTKLRLEDILFPSNSIYFNFNNGVSFYSAFLNLNTYQDLTLNLQSKFPSVISQSGIFDGVKFHTSTNPNIDIYGFDGRIKQLFYNVQALDLSDVVQHFNNVNYTLSANVSMKEEFRPSNLNNVNSFLARHININSGSYQINSLQETFAGVKGLYEYPNVDTQYATTTNGMFGFAHIHLDRDPAFILPSQSQTGYMANKTYDLSNCTDISGMFGNIQIIDKTSGINTPFQESAIPVITNTNNVEHCDSFISGTSIADSWSRNLTNNLATYSNTFANTILSTLGNSVKIKAYQTLFLFAGSNGYLTGSAFTGNGYTTPIDIYMKKDPLDTNNTVTLGRLWMNCLNMITTPRVDIYVYPGRLLDKSCILDGTLDNNSMVNIAEICRIYGNSTYGPHKATTWQGKLSSMGANIVFSDPNNINVPFVSNGYKSQMQNIEFSIIRSSFGLEYIPNLSNASLISFIEALIPYEVNNGDILYNGKGQDTTGLITNYATIRMTNAQYTNTTVLPSSIIVPGKPNATIADFWQDLSNDLGGSRNLWGYRIEWSA